MLRKSFIILERVGLGKEKNIWGQGIAGWDAFLAAERIKGISPKTKHYYNKKIREAKQQLHRQNAAYFAQLLPASEQWRLYDEFKDETVFLDIESDMNKITVVGLFDGYETKTMVDYIDKDALQQELSKYKILVTFNGRSFDVPVLERYFNITIDLPHIDLMHVCRRVGLQGGLKVIELQLNIKRPDSLKWVRGQDTAELWRCWKATGDSDFLDMLLAYNEEDCSNLQRIAQVVIPRVQHKID